jgi:hypothetical protein
VFLTHVHITPEVGRIVAVVEERLLPTIAALGDAVGHARDD